MKKPPLQKFVDDLNGTVSPQEIVLKEKLY